LEKVKACTGYPRSIASVPNVPHSLFPNNVVLFQIKNRYEMGKKIEKRQAFKASIGLLGLNLGVKS
jgi:hypothetical protein